MLHVAIALALNTSPIAARVASHRVGHEKPRKD